MNIAKLNVFLNVVKTRNLSTTAEELYMTQSAVSQNIKSLEKEFGITLIIRKNNGIEITNEGLSIANQAENVVNEYIKLNECIESIKSKPKTLRIFYTGKIEQEIIAKAISLEDSHKINISLCYGNFSEAEMKLKNDEADIVFSNPTSFENKWNTVTLKSNKLKVIASKKAFENDVVSLDDIKKYKLVTLSLKSAGIAGIKFTKQLKALGFSEEDCIQTDSIESQILLVKSGKAITLMPCLPTDNEDIKEYIIKDYNFIIDSVAAYKNSTPEIEYFLSLCKK